MYAGGGDDMLHGGPGTDVLSAGPGIDQCKDDGADSLSECETIY